MIKNRFNIFLIIAALLIIASLGVQLHYVKHGVIAFQTRLILLLLLNLSFIALLTLMFFVSKALLKLYFERRNRVLGYRFKTKLVVIIVVLTLIPSVSLFVLSGGLIANYIDRWFAPQIKEPLNSSVEIAKTLYAIERQEALDHARAALAGRANPDHYAVQYLFNIPKDATETVRTAFDGKEGTEVISVDTGDIVRAVVPAYEGGKLTGVVIVESSIPAQITKNVEDIKEAYENYLALESWKVPITANYLLILGFLTLIITFIALWVGLRISRGITDPIQNLAQATELVAAGNLDVEVDIKREDEIGLLITSFNHMIRELKEGKESLQSACLESDRRRLFIENILDNINSGVIMLDTAGYILMINKRACSIINAVAEQVMGKHYRELLAIIDSEELRNLVGGIEGREFKPVRKEVHAVIGGRHIILLVFITSLRDAQQYVGLLVVFDDLTEIIEAQKALTWQDVARKIAHEIKNPLTPIRLSTERMLKKWEQRDPDFNAVFQRSARTIVKEVDGLKRLVDDFSKFGRIPALEKTAISISSVIEDVVNLYKDYERIQIGVSLPDDPPLIVMDGERFKRVLINIFDNAIQAIPDKGRIDVTVRFDMPSNKARIDIADTGPGIRDMDKEKLFEPYFSTKRDGTGLGLAIAHRIIREHGGHIWVGDNNPSGAIFSIEIPIKEN